MAASEPTGNHTRLKSFFAAMFFAILDWVAAEFGYEIPNDVKWEIYGSLLALAGVDTIRPVTKKKEELPPPPAPGLSMADQRALAELMAKESARIADERDTADKES